MFEEKPQETAAEEVDTTSELFKQFCRALKISADQVAQIMNAPDKPTDVTRPRRGVRS
jgi:hypothetical protein